MSTSLAAFVAVCIAPAAVPRPGIVVKAPAGAVRGEVSGGPHVAPDQSRNAPVIVSRRPAR